MSSLTKGVLLLGGTGSRLAPLNRVSNKHLINIAGKPMSQWPLEKLIEAGITDLLIISGREHMGSIISYFGSGREFGGSITYKVQEAAGGIADAIKLTHGFVHDGDFFFVVLGDNIFNDPIPVTLVTEDTKIVLTTTFSETPERFGVFDHSTQRIVEKPEEYVSNDVMSGIYGYRYDTEFRHILNNLTPSARGELEVTDLNNAIIDICSAENMELVELEGYWTDAGTHSSLRTATELKYEEQQFSSIG